MKEGGRGWVSCSDFVLLFFAFDFPFACALPPVVRHLEDVMPLFMSHTKSAQKGSHTFEK